MGRFEGRVALVTGAGGGIGRATATLLAQEGAAVACADVSGDSAAATVAAVEELGASGVAIPCDVSDETSCASAVSTTVERFGGLHVLVNVAGVGGFRPFGELTLEEWNRVLEVNLTGTFLMCQQALQPLLAARGSIVNIGSTGGLRATAYNAAYCTSKAGVAMLTRVLAVEFGRAGLRVNCVCPSSVDTDFLRAFELPESADFDLLARGASVVRRKVQASEVAAAVAYLASDEAAMVTGTALVLDGGALA